MNRYFTRTFLLFLFGFLVIIAIAFAVVAFVGVQSPSTSSPTIDNSATQG